jgi:predicted transcriptional regulator YdeE
MEIIKRAGFTVAGYKITTNNKDAMEKGTIGMAWEHFFEKGIFNKVPNKLDERIYAVYTNFEEWFSEDSVNKNYDLIIGCKTSDPDGMAKWLNEVEIPEQNYSKYVAIWELPYSVVNTWEEIWKSDVKKNNTVDFEVYGYNSQKGDDSEVDIYLWMN